MIFVSNCPARPTNGMPQASSSAPGASPSKQSLAWVGPTPKTVCVRLHASDSQRRQEATSSRRSSSVCPETLPDAPALLAGCGRLTGADCFFLERGRSKTPASERLSSCCLSRLAETFPVVKGTGGLWCWVSFIMASPAGSVAARFHRLRSPLWCAGECHSERKILEGASKSLGSATLSQKRC